MSTLKDEEYTYEQWRGTKRPMPPSPGPEPELDIDVEEQDQQYLYLEHQDLPIEFPYLEFQTPEGLHVCHRAHRKAHRPQSTHARPYLCYPAATPSVAIEKTTSASKQQEEKPPKDQNIWLARTKTQIRDDDLRIAAREGVHQYNPLKPVDPKPDQVFWVIKTNGESVLRNMSQIEGGCGPGRWERDPRYGNAYYICEAEGKA